MFRLVPLLRVGLRAHAAAMRAFALLSLCGQAIAYAAPVPGSFVTGWGDGTGSRPSISVSSTTDAATTGYIQTDGKAVMAGSCSATGISNTLTGNLQCIIRLNAQGSDFDAGFRGAKGDFTMAWPGRAAFDNNNKTTIRAIAKDVVSAFTPGGFVLVSTAPSQVDQIGLLAMYRGGERYLYNNVWPARTDANTLYDLLDSARYGPFVAQPKQDINGFLMAHSCKKRQSNETGICVMTYENTDLTNARSTFLRSGNTPGTRFVTYAGIKPYANALTIEPQDRIVVSGRCLENASGINWGCLIRFNNDGSPQDVDILGNPSYLRLPTAEEVYDTVVQPDGNLWRTIALAQCRIGIGDGKALCLTAVNNIGVLAADWNPQTGATVILSDVPGRSLSTASNAGKPRLVVQPDGKLLVAYACETSVFAQEFCIARFNANGTPDTSFLGPAGASAGQFSFVPTGAKESTFADLSLAPNGNIFVAGNCKAPGFRQPAKFCASLLHGGPYSLNIVGSSVTREQPVLLLRYLLGFRGKGFFENIPGVDSSAIRRDPYFFESYLSTFVNKPATDQQCWAGISNGSEARATVDGLLLLRLSLGIRGANLVAGIGFPPDATRTDPTEIANFYQTLCLAPS
jgi:uncharacterized delta-60 repeat protein